MRRGKRLPVFPMFTLSVVTAGTVEFKRESSSAIVGDDKDMREVASDEVRYVV